MCDSAQQSIEQLASMDRAVQAALAVHSPALAAPAPQQQQAAAAANGSETGAAAAAVEAPQQEPQQAWFPFMMPSDRC
ncbi:hypothetical protein TSOC_005133 [Tetrabaena socialis]|uniref:Uncharacterized protein n=1 Tax=Tetrabaena socialis TaxID=47790 RepID=A0A2J8A703_9CHLO|nr:hypothetical protein TSOC_005133 [Tetrabaena socialis]|eukprot:PNH08312.1 hypothetical protein TSOC_005133 [Tetrabaena socialis]